jgi:hypothetical protein
VPDLVQKVLRRQNPLHILEPWHWIRWGAGLRCRRRPRVREVDDAPDRAGSLPEPSVPAARGQHAVDPAPGGVPGIVHHVELPPVLRDEGRIAGRAEAQPYASLGGSSLLGQAEGRRL